MGLAGEAEPFQSAWMFAPGDFKWREGRDSSLFLWDLWYGCVGGVLVALEAAWPGGRPHAPSAGSGGNSWQHWPQAQTPERSPRPDNGGERS